jgi:hypothetical protein
MNGQMAPPTFVLGAPRSGTSLVYKALCLHPDTAWINNYLRQLPSRRELAALNRMAPLAPGRRSRVWFGSDGSNAYVYGSPRGRGDRFFPMPVEGEPLLRWCGLSDSGQTVEPGVAERLRRVVAQVQRWSGAHYFINKRIANNQRVPQLLSAFPDARFLVVTRDGRAVAASLAKVDWWPTTTLFWCQQTPDDWARSGGDSWELCAREWVQQIESIEKGLEGVPAEQVFRVSFELFIESPLATLHSMARFIGLPASPRWEADLARLRFPPRANAWQKELEQPVLETIERYQLPVLRSHGYA